MTDSAARRPLELAVIGTVRTDVPDEEIARRRRDIVSHVDVDPRYADGLLGLDAYSQIFVLFWMDRTPRADTLHVRPRGDATLPPVGVFAQRGRQRPNPLGLAVVDLLGIEGCRLTVRRLDAFDGTPVVDIKPYDPYDVFPAPRVPAWLAARIGRQPPAPG